MKKKPHYVGLGDRIDDLITDYGGLRAAACALKIDAGYLSRLRDGSKTAPSNALCERMGLKKHTVYTLI